MRHTMRSSEPANKVATCQTCQASNHTTDEHYVEAFINPVTRKNYPIPNDIRKAAESICRTYGLRGICDPMYIANVFAKATGRGDGESHFYAVDERCQNCQESLYWDPKKQQHLHEEHRYEHCEPGPEAQEVAERKLIES